MTKEQMRIVVAEIMGVPEESVTIHDMQASLMPANGWYRYCDILYYRFGNELGMHAFMEADDSQRYEAFIRLHGRWTE